MGPAAPVPGPEAPRETVVSDRASSDFPIVGSVDTEPDLDLVQMDPDNPMSFFGSIAAVRTLPDGSLLVADARTGTIGIFDGEGTPVRRMGSQGEAPGQFRTLSNVPLATRDSIWVWDEQASRITIFPLDGGQPAVRTVFGGASTRYWRMHVLEDRSFLAVARSRTLGTGLTPGATVAQRDSIAFTRFDASGRLMGPVLAIPGEEWLQLQYGSSSDFMMTVTAQLPLGRDGAYGVLGDGIVGGPNDRFELRRWDFGGELLRLTRYPSMDERLTEADVSALEAEALEAAEGVPERIEHIEAIFDPAFVPEFRPAFRRIVVGGQGRVWIEEYDPWDAGPTQWWLYDDRTGELVGTVEVPAGLEVHEFGTDEVLGVFRDETGLPHVRRHALRLRLP
jgi:hypothetical protein